MQKAHEQGKQTGYHGGESRNVDKDEAADEEQNDVNHIDMPDTPRDTSVKPDFILQDGGIVEKQGRENTKEECQCEKETRRGLERTFHEIRDEKQINTEVKKEEGGKGWQVKGNGSHEEKEEETPVAQQ